MARKKPTFLQLEIPPGFEVKKPPKVVQQFTTFNEIPFLNVTVVLQRKVSIITKSLVK